ncbi:hypothetical protein FQR65_LT19822 [Abscondita terminalis]|nr:hypothetical protein FQR65_LT19822 [Abscondita terminalis]
MVFYLYFSARVGKIYHYGVPSQIGTNGQDDALSWNVRINPIGIDKQQEDKITNYMPGVPLGGALSFWAAPGTDDDQTDGKVANEAVKLMEEHKDKPFFLAVGFFRPHTPYVAPKKYFDMYPLEKITLAKQSDTDWDNKPAIAKYTLKDNYGLTEQQQKEVKRAYYASISFMDAQVGKLLDKTGQLGLQINTIIVFWKRSRFCTGQHKQWPQAAATIEHVRQRLPLLLQHLDLPKGKRVKRGQQNLLNLFPTLADLGRQVIKAPAREIQGKSLVPVLKEPSKTIDTPAFTQLDKTLKQKLWYPNIDKDYTGRSVRYKEWRYTEWNEGKDGSELYNYEKDPDEFNNLANNPKYSKGDVNVSGPVGNKGWTYTAGAFMNYDPGTYKLGFARNTDQTKIFRFGITKYFPENKGKITMLYKYADSYVISNYALFRYGENGKVTELDNFRIGRDSYIVNDGKVKMLNSLTGDHYWAAIDRQKAIPLHPPGQAYSGNIGTQLVQSTPKTPITSLQGRFSIDKKIGNHHVTVGLLEQYYKINKYTSDRSFFFQTAESQPQRLIGPKTDSDGFYNYNVGAEYHNGTENKLSVYANDEWKATDNLNLSYGLIIRNNTINGDYSLTPRKPGFTFRDAVFTNINYNWLQLGGAVSATYNILKSFGLLANFQYNEENTRLESYSQAFEPNPRKIKSPLGGAGIFFGNTKYSNGLSGYLLEKE